MLDITLETPISLTAVTKILPPIDGRRPSVSTVWRWCRRGIRGISLEYVRVGSRVCTSQEALNRFVNKLAAADSMPARVPTPRPPAPRKRTASQRERAIAEAQRALERAGI
jgi:hypothetical protein